MTATQSTVNGVDFLLLLDENVDKQTYAEMLEQAMAVYTDFNFAEK